MSANQTPGANAGTGSEKNPGQGGPPHVNIQIDREHFKVESQALTGAELRSLPATPVPASRDLFQVVPGGSDVKIADGDTVALKSGMRFFTAPSQINPGSPASDRQPSPRPNRTPAAQGRTDTKR